MSLECYFTCSDLAFSSALVPSTIAFDPTIETMMEYDAGSDTPEQQIIASSNINCTIGVDLFKSAKTTNAGDGLVSTSTAVSNPSMSKSISITGNVCYQDFLKYHYRTIVMMINDYIM